LGGWGGDGGLYGGGLIAVKPPDQEDNKDWTDNSASVLDNKKRVNGTNEVNSGYVYTGPVPNGPKWIWSENRTG